MSRRVLLEEVTYEMVAALLDYDAETGVFTWKKSRSRATKGQEAGTVNSKGYRKISINGRQIYAHRLAWLLAKGEWPKDVINHKNGNKLDNRLANLEDIPHGQNTRHGFLAGYMNNRGERNGSAKLTASDVLRIRSMNGSCNQIAKQFGVAGFTVSRIRKGELWGAPFGRSK